MNYDRVVYFNSFQALNLFDIEFNVLAFPDLVFIRSCSSSIEYGTRYPRIERVIDHYPDFFYT